MLNPTNGDPSHVVVNYVEEYLDLVESLPFDLQRSVSLMKEIDAKYQGKKESTHSYSKCYLLKAKCENTMLICILSSCKDVLANTACHRQKNTSFVWYGSL